MHMCVLDSCCGVCIASRRLSPIDDNNICHATHAKPMKAASRVDGEREVHFDPDAQPTLVGEGAEMFMRHSREGKAA